MANKIPNLNNYTKHTNALIPVGFLMQLIKLIQSGRHEKHSKIETRIVQLIKNCGRKFLPSAPSFAEYIWPPKKNSNGPSLLCVSTEVTKGLPIRRLPSTFTHTQEPIRLDFVCQHKRKSQCLKKNYGYGEEK